MNFILLGCVGIVSAFILTYLSIRYFPQWGLLDFPERYQLKRPRLPYPGGLIFLSLSLFLGLIDVRFLPVIFGVSIIGLLSFLDDRYNLSAKLRLMVHLLVAVFIFYMGIRINFIGNPFSHTNIELWLNWPYLAFGLTILWIIIIQNAINWFDGVAGLSVGISGIGFFTLGLLGIIRPELFFDPTHTSLTLANFYLSGCCLGGFYYFWQKKILLGDTGSQTLGFLLAVMAIFSGAKIATMLLVLSLPLLDFFVVIVRRIFIEKRSPLKGDLNHAHHHLKRLIGEKYTSLSFILISFLFGLMSIFFTGIIKVIILFIAVIITLIGIFWLNLQSPTRFKKSVVYREKNTKEPQRNSKT